MIYQRILPLLLTLAILGGCGEKQAQPKPLTVEERTQLYQTAIENARDQETNDAMGVVTSTEDSTAPLLLELLGLTEEDMNAFALSVSAMNVKAYAIAAVYPAPGQEEEVQEGLNAFVEQQKQNFKQYLVDQYEIASNARLETLEDGTILLVMSEHQDEVFDAIRDTIEAAA